MRATIGFQSSAVRSWWACGILGLAALSTGCGSIGPSESTHGTLRTVLTLEPAVVQSGERFALRVEMINQGDEPLSLVQGSSCAFNTSVRRGGEDPLEDAFPETGYGCLTVLTPLEIPPQGRFVETRMVTANVSPGDFEVKINWTIADPPVRDLAAKLTVLP